MAALEKVKNVWNRTSEEKVQSWKLPQKSKNLSEMLATRKIGDLGQENMGENVDEVISKTKVMRVRGEIEEAESVISSSENAKNNSEKKGSSKSFFQHFFGLRK